MAASPAFPLKIYYDGSCSVCASEIYAYRRKEHGGRLIFIDIGAPGFDPSPSGITLDEFMHDLHAIDRVGHVYRGVEAFCAIWRAFPASKWYALLATLVALPGVNSLARLAYRSFARIRKYLPENHDAGEDGTCQSDKNRHQ